MFLPIKQDNFPQKQSTSGKKKEREEGREGGREGRRKVGRKEMPNTIWGQNKNK